EKTMLEEHTHVREEVGVFDVSHMGEFRVMGERSIEFLNSILTNHIEKIAVGQIQYNLMCNESGGVIDDLIVYRFETHFLLVVNAGNIEKDFDWVSKQAIAFDVEVENISKNLGQIAIQGPKSEAVLQKSVRENLSKLKFFHFIETEIVGCLLILSRSGYTGEDGFEIYCQAVDAEKIWCAIFSNSAENILPIGLGARDTLRVEAALPLYGHELNGENIPWEFKNIQFAIKLDKEFIGKDAVLEFSQNMKTQIIGLETAEKIIPREGMEIYNSKEVCVGEFTSGCFSPTLSKTVAMARVEVEKIGDESEFFLKRGKKMVPLEVTAMPFFSKKYKK
ncbi:MAG: glycine cleavage system aminomethyltransferase GcvT, partial [Fusobacteria bacterium]|nr:glycine cleavage system aminomethyltransferase GcvT [Fusobacteriota bacterium]